MLFFRIDAHKNMLDFVVKRIKSIIRSILAKCGYIVLRMDTAMPSSLEDYLKNIPKRGINLEGILCFDDEHQIQNDILGVYSSEKVIFTSYPLNENGSIYDLKAQALLNSKRKYLVEVDLEFNNFLRIAEDASWIFGAEIILLRSTLGFYWSGGGDLNIITTFLREKGFRFFDVLDYGKVSFFQGPLGRIVLVFEKKGVSRNVCDRHGGRFARVSTAQAWLSEPIAKSSKFVRIASRGSFGFADGVLNPGVIATRDRLRLLAAGEHYPWAIAKKDINKFISGVRPLIIELSRDLSILRGREAIYKDKGQYGDSRLADFRLFQYRNQILSNHYVIMGTKGNVFRRGEIRPELLKTRMGISLVDFSRGELKFLGIPNIGRKLNLIEKNWAFFEHEEELYLIYSFNPYHLLRARRWSDLDFETVLQKDLVIPLSDGELFFRNSANPVEYDDEYFLHVVHNKYPGPKNVFWAVLIDKETLLPKKITSRPLLRGWQSSPAQFIYACSIVPRERDILIFGGINDSSIGIWNISRTSLEACWNSIEA